MRIFQILVLSPFFAITAIGQDMPDSISKTYYNSGKIKSETPYKNGRKNGNEKWYYESGNLKSESPYDTTGENGIAKVYYNNGNIKSEIPLLGGLPNGMIKDYFENGKLQIEYEESASELIKKTGRAKIYNETGKLIKEYPNNGKGAITLDVDKIGDSLRTNGIDTFIIYTSYCYFCAIPAHATNLSVTQIFEDFCENADPVFILYKKAGHVYIQKRNVCYFFKTLTLGKCKQLDFCMNNFDSIAKEQLPHKVIDSNGNTISVEKDVSDGKFTNMYLSKGISKSSVYFNWYIFKKPNGSVGEETKIDYEYHINMKTYKLALLVEDEIKHLAFTKE